MGSQKEGKTKTSRQNREFPYLNRELSWLDFNLRVLEEAYRKENPVLERLKFLAITASNLDEFFMVRVANIREQIRLGYQSIDATQLPVAQLYVQIIAKCHEFMEKQYNCLLRSILPAMRKNGIYVLKPSGLDEEQLSFLQNYFNEVLFPILTPMAVDASRPFPFLANRSLNIACRLKKEGENFFAVVQVPSILPRFLEIPCKEGKGFVLLEDVILLFCRQLFEGFAIKAAIPFRITRNSDMHIDEQADDILIEVQKSLKKRKKGKPVRLELPKSCDDATKKYLVHILKVKKEEIFECASSLDLTAWMRLASLEEYDSLRLPVAKGVWARDFTDCEDLFARIREGDCMVHHPYENFDVVTRFVQDAANDPDVLAIKQTLYRVSGHSPIVSALMQAASNGKQVTVLVELKARFDEEHNIQWAKMLEQAGCHVIYGFPELKTHCKLLLVVRREEDGIRRYLHTATGNYNDSTAKVYTDIGMFTCREELVEDATALFNTLTGYTRDVQYRSLVVAPHHLRNFFADAIHREIDNARQGLPCGMVIKVNSLLDDEIIALLYEASRAGVPVQLNVRGICSLVAGVEGVSDRIQVISIVGQYLEHSRIFRFENAGNPLYYMGSADLMPRNLDRRIEVMFPILEERLKERVQWILDVLLQDNYNARDQLPDGSYRLRTRRGKKRVNAQQEFVKRVRKGSGEN